MTRSKTSKRFLLTTWQGGGSLPPMLTVARKLLEAGHAVRLMSDNCDRADVLAIGVDFTPWTTAPSRNGCSAEQDPVKDWLSASPVEGIMRTLDGVVTGPSLTYANDLRAELACRPVDLVVTNEMLLGVAVGCEAAEQPYALLTANISLFPLPGVPPMGPGLRPAETDEEKAMHAAIAEQMTGLLDYGLPALNSARSALGLAPLNHVAEQLNSASAILLGTSQAFDFAPPVMPVGWRYVGPQMDLPVWAVESEPVKVEPDRPLVAVCFSTTFQNQGAVIQAVLDAAADLPVQVIATLGPALDGTQISVPQNARLIPSSNHDALMHAAACVVTHGGHGTILRALAHGRPILTMPMGRDQVDNAVRVSERGAGLTLPPTAPASDIAVTLRRLLNEPEFGENARRLGEQISREIEQSVVVPVLEQLAVANKLELAD